MGAFRFFFSTVLFGVTLLVSSFVFAAGGLDHELARVSERTYHAPQEALATLAAIQATHSALTLEQQATFLEVSSRAKRGAGDLPGALEQAKQLEALGKRTGNKSIECLALLQQVYHSFVSGQVQTSHELARRAQQFLSLAITPVARVKTLLMGAQAHDEAREPAQADRLVAQAIRVASEADDADLMFLAIKSSAERAIAANNYEQASADVTRLLELAKKSPYPERFVRAKYTEYRFASAAGLGTRARQVMDENIALMRKLQLDKLLGTTLIEYSDLQLKRNRFSDAAALTTQALLLESVLSDKPLARTAYFNNAIALIYLGRVAEGKKTVEQLFSTSQNRQEILDHLPEYVAALTHAGDTNAAVRASALLRQIEAETTVQDYKAQEGAQLQIGSLTLESRLRAIEASNERAKRTLWQAAAIVSALGALGILIVYRRLRTARNLLENANAQLYTASTRDFLTGLHNRRYIENIATELFANSAGLDTPGARASQVLFLIDVDHFKQVNDTYGHTVGDRVLKHVAERIAVALGDTGLIARWGGEEFLALFPAADIEETASIASRVLRAVSSAPVVVDDITLEVAISLGVCRLQLILAERAATWGEILHLADECLYVAKQQGRNRAYVVIDSAGTAAPETAGTFTMNCNENNFALLEVLSTLDVAANGHKQS